MEYDLWFSRYEDHLFAVLAPPGEPPMSPPRKVASVSAIYKRLRKNGHGIAQVGILDPEMIGLE